MFAKYLHTPRRIALLKSRPTVALEYMTMRTRVALITAAVIWTLAIGFVGGLIVGVTTPEATGKVVSSLESPKATTSVWPPAIEDWPELPEVPGHDIHNPRRNLYSTTYQDAAVAASKRMLRTDVRWNPEDYDKEIECLAQNIYFEAKSESLKGQIAVGLVTINRVLSEKYPNTICEVVWQKRKHPKTGKWVAQFSWTWDGKHDNPRNKEAYEQIELLASAMLAEGSLFNFDDFTEGATHYHAVYVKPYWRKHFTLIAKVDTHIFYRDEKATPRFIHASTKEEPVANKSSDDI